MNYSIRTIPSRVRATCACGALLSTLLIGSGIGWLAEPVPSQAVAIDAASVRRAAPSLTAVDVTPGRGAILGGAVAR